jgi:predicted nuclease with TOPRIM domain
LKKDGQKMEENTKFKTTIVGGFDKGDVVNYIKKLATERNELRKAYEESEEKFKSLTDSLDKKGIENKEAAEKVYRLSIEVEKYKRRFENIQRENEESKQFKIDFIDNTLEKLSKVETTIAVVNENITTAFERAHTELMVACDTLAEIAPMLEKSFKQFDEIRANIDEQKQTLLEGDKKQIHTVS